MHTFPEISDHVVGGVGWGWGGGGGRLPPKLDPQVLAGVPQHELAQLKHGGKKYNMTVVPSLGDHSLRGMWCQSQS